MPIYRGDEEAYNLYVGGTKIKQAYIGDTLIYPTENDLIYIIGPKGRPNYSVAPGLREIVVGGHSGGLGTGTEKGYFGGHGHTKSREEWDRYPYDSFWRMNGDRWGMRTGPFNMAGKEYLTLSLKVYNWGGAWNAAYPYPNFGLFIQRPNAQYEDDDGNSYIRRWVSNPYEFIDPNGDEGFAVTYRGFYRVKSSTGAPSYTSPEIYDDNLIVTFTNRNTDYINETHCFVIETFCRSNTQYGEVGAWIESGVQFLAIHNRRPEEIWPQAAARMEVVLE